MSEATLSQFASAINAAIQIKSSKATGKLKHNHDACAANDFASIRTGIRF
jgi:hypothetical protein